LKGLKKQRFKLFEHLRYTNRIQNRHNTAANHAALSDSGPAHHAIGQIKEASEALHSESGANVRIRQ